MFWNKAARIIVSLLLSNLILIFIAMQSRIDAADSRTTQPEISINKPPVLPNPLVEFTGKENYQANGQNWTRSKLAVKNHAAYPNAMFAAAPFLPPCGTNTNSSRTWVNIYHYVALKMPPQYIYGFCAFSTSDELVNLWFASPAGRSPPSPVVVVLEDRQTKKNYVSNTVAIPSVPLQ